MFLLFFFVIEGKSLIQDENYLLFLYQIILNCLYFLFFCIKEFFGSIRAEIRPYDEEVFILFRKIIGIGAVFLDKHRAADPDGSGKTGCSFILQKSKQPFAELADQKRKGIGKITCHLQIRLLF